MNKNLLFSFLLTACASEYEIKGERPDVNPGDVTECSFSPVSGTKISSYDCNPVFSGGEEGAGSVAFHSTEVLGHPFYQIWYTDENGALNYAASADGTNWDDNPQNPALPLDTSASAWDRDSLAGQVVVWDPVENQYIMTYQGINYGDPNSESDNEVGIGVATSPDGLTWTRHPNNPVIDFNQYRLTENEYTGILFGGSVPAGKEISPSWPLTITVDNRGNLRGYVGASATSDLVDYFNSAEYQQWTFDSLFNPNLPPPPFNQQINIYSMNGFSAGEWVLNTGQPVLAGGESYDLFGMTSAAVVEYNDVQYMFYVGFAAWEEVEDQSGFIVARKKSLNLATSTDGGNTWVKDPNNPIPINTTSALEVSDVGAQVVGSRILLWVTDNYDGKQAVGYFYYEPDTDPNE
ncbi:MAG: hypothetical protein VX278_02490 [Myxococcota bacterium]|nr:hypothetical protein [Myxococcota bacterium]